MYIENYSIHGIINFQLVNKNASSLLKAFTPEFEYFRTYQKNDLDFRITITNSYYKTINDQIKYKFYRQYNKWDVEIIEYDFGFIDLIIIPRLSGVRKHMEYFSLKSIYVRSLIYYCLIKKGGTLVHSSGININNEAYLFVGRPGVYKTTLLMDILRNSDATFLGEENTILYNGKIYPFPFHLRSLAFRLKHYKTEDPQTIFHKYWQILSLFLNNRITIPISGPANLNTIFYVEKLEKYSCQKVEYSDIHDKLVTNEIQELNIKCNPRLSAGINNNFFSDFLIENDILIDIMDKLSKTFNQELSDCSFFSLFMPVDYQKYLSEYILKMVIDRSVNR